MGVGGRCWNLHTYKNTSTLPSAPFTSASFILSPFGVANHTPVLQLFQVVSPSGTPWTLRWPDGLLIRLEEEFNITTEDHLEWVDGEDFSLVRISIY